MPWPLCIHQYLQYQYPPVPSLGLRSLDIHMSHSLLDILIIHTDTWCLGRCMYICMWWSALILNMIFWAWCISVQAIFLPPHPISSLECKNYSWTLSHLAFYLGSWDGTQVAWHSQKVLLPPKPYHRFLSTTPVRLSFLLFIAPILKNIENAFHFFQQCRQQERKHFYFTRNQQLSFEVLPLIYLHSLLSDFKTLPFRS